MIAPETDLGFVPDTANDLGFTPDAPPAAIPSSYSPSVPPSDTPPPQSPWATVYAGLDGLDQRLNEQQKLAFGALDRNSPDPKEARARAINQAYVFEALGSNPKALPMMQRNWEAWKASYVENQLGMGPSENISDTTFYGLIAKKLQEPEEQHSKLSAWWEEVNKPIKALPRFTDAPDIPALGLHNPALGAAVWNSTVAPFAESMESPFGLATLETGAVLYRASKAYPLAKTALAGMSGIFAGLMGYETKKGLEAAPKVLNDPNASFQEKVEAVAAPVSAGLQSIFGALGTAFLLLPKGRATATAAKLKEATPAEGAQILREEAKAITEEANAETKPTEETKPETGAETTMDDQPPASPERQSDFLMDAAAELDAIASKADREAVKTVTKELAAEKVAEKPTEEPTAPAEEPAPIPENAAPEEAATLSIKNANVDAELEKMGLPKATHGEKLTFEKAREGAAETLKEDPFAGQKLIEELKKKNRPLTGEEDALLTHEQVRLKIERDRAEQAVIDAAETGDPAAIEAAKERVDTVRKQYQEAADIVTQSGTKNAQGLALRRMMLKEDYSLAAMERKRSVANEGRPLTEAQAAEVKELHDRIAAKQKEFDTYRSRMSELLMAEEPKPKLAKATRPREMNRPPAPNRLQQYLTDRAGEARERIRKRMAEGRVLSGIDPVDLADHVLVGAEYLSRGVTKFADWSAAMVKEFGKKIEPYLNEIFTKAQDEQKKAVRLEAYKTRARNRITDLKGRIETNNLVREKPTPLHLDKEANRLQAELESLKSEFDRKVEADRYRNSSTLNKIKENALFAYDTARLLMTTGEFSFILRQGKTAVLSHPILSAKALPNTFRAFLENPEGARAINLEVLNHPDAPLARASKLHLLEEGQSLNKQEELLMSKITGHKLLEKTVGRFNQAAETFINRVRFDLWNEMRKSADLNASEQKQAAMFVNEATGRGTLGSLEVAAVPLGRVMFSPRYLASRIQLVSGHSMWGGTARSRAAIAKEYAKTLVGLGIYYSALLMAYKALGNDVEIGDDPRSSDFGKVKIGKTRIDPLAGVAQVIVFASRTATGEKKSLTGKVSPIRGDKVPYGGDRWTDVAARFARSKLHPVPGAIVNLFDGTDLAGQKADITNQALNLSAPVTYMDIYQALEEQDLPEGVSLGLLALLGEGLQTYNRKPTRSK